MMTAMSHLFVAAAQTEGAAGWLTGVFGVAGVTAGAVIAWVSTYMSDKRRDKLQAYRDAQQQQREDSQRWDAMVLEVAGRFLREIATNVVLVKEQREAIARRLGIDPKSRKLVIKVIRASVLHPIEYYKMLRALRKSFAGRRLRYLEVEQALNELIIISSPKVVTASRDLSRAHYALMPMQLEGSEEERLQTQYKERRDIFIDSVSSEMNVTSKAGKKEFIERYDR